MLTSATAEFDYNVLYKYEKRFYYAFSTLVKVQCCCLSIKMICKVTKLKGTYFI